MNSDFYEDLDINFEKACNMCNSDFSHEELISMLKNGNIPQKQFAALNIEGLNNNDELTIFLSNLTGCDGKIREAVAFRMFELLKNHGEYYSLLIFNNANNIAKIFADATIDINANICRLIVDSLKIMKKNDVFCIDYAEYIVNFINEAFENLDKIIYRDKKYKINKQLFKLYWCLEALKLVSTHVQKDKLYYILKRASEEQEYTIREKVAQLLMTINDNDFEGLKQTLANDNNYYVHKALTQN